MVQAAQQFLTFEEFLEWYPEDGKRYELIDGEIVEMRPVGDHEEIAGLITRKLDREIERLNLPDFIPKTCCIKPNSNIDGYVPDVIVLDRRQLQSEPLWKKASTITVVMRLAPVIHPGDISEWMNKFIRDAGH